MLTVFLSTLATPLVHGLNTGMHRLAIVLLVAVSANFSSLAQAGGISGNQALLAVAGAKGGALLGSLLEMRGADGAPQPAQWTLSFKDEAARGGVREFVVNETGIAGERTPLQPGDVASAAPVASASIKTDSTEVFTAANAEASRAMVGFYSVNYRLRDKAGTPVWFAELFDVDGNEVGSLEISAVDGALISPLRAAVPAPSISATAPVSAPAATPAAPSAAALWMRDARPQPSSPATVPPQVQPRAGGATP